MTEERRITFCSCLHGMLCHVTRNPEMDMELDWKHPHHCTAPKCECQTWEPLTDEEYDDRIRELIRQRES